MPDSQYPPNHSLALDSIHARRRFWLRAICISLVGVAAPPMIGVAVTVFSMRKAFGNLSQSGSGISEPAALSSHISAVLVSTASGIVLSLIAFIVLVVAMIRFFALPKVTDQCSSNSA